MLDVTVLQGKAEPISNPQNIQTIGSGVPQAFGGVKTEGRAAPNFMNKGASAGGFGQQPQAGAPGAIPTSFHPIASLHPYHTRWTIKARVTAKGERRTWQNDKGNGSLFSVDLLDAHGGQIKATMFSQ